jgi:uncharacterized protein YecE (DUF72 family)
MERVHVGISGWRYPHWRGRFYPRGLVQRAELAYAAERLDAIELNGSFYSLQRPESYARWRDQTPDGFTFAVKGSRFVTHMKKLVECEVPLANFFASGVLALGPKLGPFLWQIPERFPIDLGRITAFFELLPRDTAAAVELAKRHDARLEGRSFLETDAVRPLRHAFEVRHPDLVTPAAIAAYEQHGIALVCADTAGRWPLTELITADFAYVRLHGAEKLYFSQYGSGLLDVWEERICGWDVTDAYVFFDNDALGHAPYDAMALRARMRHAGCTLPRREVPMSELTADKRDHLADRQFAFPKQRKEPIEDASHVRNAIARFNQVEDVTDAERDEAWKRIKAAAKRFGVEVHEKSWREIGHAKKK